MSSRIHWVPGIPCNTWSMALCQIAGDEEMPKTKRLYWKRPLCVLIVRNFLGFLCYFHLVISLAQVKFAKMLTPSQIPQNILYVWQRILFCKKHRID